MKYKQLILIGMLSLICIKTVSAKVVWYSGFKHGPTPALAESISKEVCEHKYSDKEIKTMEKAASKGDSLAQLKLGIFYNIKSVQLYKQVSDNKSIDIDRLNAATLLLSKTSSPCEYF
ncbi:hypothetical protein [Snodgrassella communis]|jgi:hypothetical protein|uniref:hypothetical protein n=1 Tax=Snodgrassella communis TaxID=2946699 RepID=UPI000C1E599E|nr:hypothetical protein [Snodgrassella communis]PIT23218.1 hypothetical protein BGI35_02370 [Snodgrassella communis]